MGEFFHYYTAENPCENAFLAFSIQHIFFLLLVALYVLVMVRSLKNCTAEGVHRREKLIITLFVLGEWFYYGWNILTSPNPPYMEIIPLHLCSICVYVSAVAIFLDNEKLRRFMAVVNTLGACIALVYPATVDAMFPVISYRVTYFFLAHGTILLLGILQIQRFGCLNILDMKFNAPLIAVFAALAFFTNLRLHTDYLFLGAPPTLGIVRAVYDVVGVRLLLPVAIVSLVTLMAGAILLINGIVHLTRQRRSEWEKLRLSNDKEQLHERDSR